MVFGTDLYFPELTSKWKNMPDQDAGRGLCTEQLPSHAQELGGGGGQHKADPQRVGPFWALSPPPWQGGSQLLL